MIGLKMALTNRDVAVIAGMVGRGDKDHDIAAWFGENQARIAEAKNGAYGPFLIDPEIELPPKGAPGPKGRRLRGAVKNAINMLESGDAPKTILYLKEALTKFERNEN